MSLFDKAKDKLSEHKDQVASGIDKVGDQAKSRFEDHSDQIDKGVTKAKDALNRDS